MDLSLVNISTNNTTGTVSSVFDVLLSAGSEICSEPNGEKVPIEIWAQIGLVDIAAHWALVRTVRAYWLYLRKYPQLLHKLAQWVERENCKQYMLGRWVYQTVDGGPSVVYQNGCLVWYWNDHPHREDGPAIIDEDGNQIWYCMGETSRAYGPAVIYADGEQVWYSGGKIHRVGGPARIRANGTQEWYWMGRLHRVDGPAIIRANGEEEWWFAGHMCEKSYFGTILLGQRFRVEI